jgi:hypothetical protein
MGDKMPRFPNVLCESERPLLAMWLVRRFQIVSTAVNKALQGFNGTKLR